MDHPFIIVYAADERAAETVRTWCTREVDPAGVHCAVMEDGLSSALALARPDIAIICDPTDDAAITAFVEAVTSTAPAAQVIAVATGSMRSAREQKRRTDVLRCSGPDQLPVVLDAALALADRRNIEADLRAQLAQTEETYRSLITLIPDPVIMYDDQGRILSANDAAIAYAGFESYEVFIATGMRLLDFVDPTDLALAENDLSVLFAGAHAPTPYYRARRRDGTAILADVTSRVLSQMDGRSVVLSIIRDVTERERTRELLQLSEEKFAKLFHANPMPCLLTLTRSGVIIDANAGFERVFGHRRDHVLGRSTVDLDLWRDPGDREAVLDLLETQGRLDRHPVEFKTAAGQVRNVLLTADQYRLEEETYLLTAIEDITEHILTEAALSREQERAEQYLDIAASIILVLDVDGTVVLANRKVCQILGLPQEQITGKNWFQTFLPVAIRDEVERLFTRMVRGDVPLVEQFQNEIITSTGEVRIITWQNALLYNEAGAVVRVLSSGIDITEHARAEERLRFTQFAVDHSSDAAFWISSDGRFVYVNEAASAELGYSRAELREMSVPDIDPLFPDARWFSFWSDIRTAGSRTFESIHRTRSGRNIPVEITCSFVVFEGREFLCAFSRDISERKSTIQQLELTQFALDRAALAVFWTLPDGSITYVNRYACTFLGYSHEELTRMHTWDLNPDHLGGSWDQHWDELRELGHMAFEAVLRTADGGEAPVEITANYLDFHGTEFNVAFAVDISDRRAAARRIEEERNLLRDVLEAIPDEVYLKDAESRFMLVNSATVRALGRSSQEDVLGKTDRELIPESWADDAIEEERRLFASGIPVINREGMLRRDTRTGAIERAILISKYPLRDAAGSVTGLVGVNRDITQRMQDEERIQTGEERLALALDAARCGVFSWALEDDRFEVNRQLASLLGFTEEELSGRLQKLLTLVHPEDAPSVRASLDGLRSHTGDQVNSEARFRTRNGMWKWLSLSGRLIAPSEDNRERVTGILLDISDRKRAEEELRRRETQYRVVVETTGDTIAVIDREGVMQFCNSTAARQIGMPQELVIGKSVRELYPEEFSAFIMTLMAEAAVAKAGRTAEHQLFRDGDVRWRRVTVEPIREANGDVSSMLVVSRDIDDEKSAELAIIAAKERAERSDRLKDAFIANISHEIRTPLNTICGYAQVIQEVFENRISPKERRFFDSIQSGSDRLMRTVDEILTFSRLQTGDAQPTYKSIDLGELLHRLVSDFRMIAQKRALTLAFINECGQVDVVADEYYLSQSVANLIDNALKFTHTGSVTVRLFYGEDDRASVEVRDTGIGISEEYLPYVFEPYSQEEVGHSRGYDGIGLGLALVKRYLMLVHADVTVESEKGKGSAFTILLQERRTAQAQEEPADDAGGNGNGMPVVLVVEDDETTVEYLELILQSGHTVLSAPGANEAWRILRRRRVDIILMDISLRGRKNGIELTREIRQSPEYGAVPIIALTAHAFPVDRNRCLEAGCNEFIAKPMSKSHLLRAIAHLLSAERSGSGEGDS